ncbi:MAG TPA: hypothetical protein VGK73_16490 [Polyangiaceae bacterium]
MTLRVLAASAVFACAAASGPVAFGQSPPASSTVSAPPVEDIGWPRQLTRDGTTLVYYQPELDAWEGYQTLVCRVAFSLTPKGGKPVLGVATLQASTLVDKDTRTAFLRDILVRSVRFPTADPRSVPELDRLFRSLIPGGGEAIAVDRILAMMEQSRLAARPTPVKNDPPAIFYSAIPSLLLVVDGDPVHAPIEKTDLEFVVNTNWDVFYEKAHRQYYLLASNVWLTAKDLAGPWTATRVLPADMSKLPAGENFDDVKKLVPAPAAKGAPPQVFYSRGPAELILLKGAPVYAKVPGTRLLYVTNTDGDIFVDDATRQYYVLLSGRWFRSASLGGPFTFASADLPTDFLKIPANSPKVSVRTSVPGTQEAADAVMLAQIPTTAIIDRAQAEARASVSYDGKPQFAAIPPTALAYAVNTEQKVIKVGDLYYLCFQGVWFVSTSPNGPWKTADSIPQEIYAIPPSSPVYNVTYVTQTNPTTTTVESSYTSGYVGMFVVGMSVGFALAWGTGYYYPPFIYRPPGYYPVYRPWPCSYGVGAVYNPRTGGYAVGRAAYGPYGAAGGAAWYNPATGRYGRSASVQGPYGGRTVQSSYNPWTGSYSRTQQSHNAYAQWGSSVATRGNDWVKTGHVSTARGTTGAFRTSGGESGVVSRGQNGTVARTSNGVYAGKDGNVYRRNDRGDWSQYQNGSWNQVERSAPQTRDLDDAARARERGQAETQRQRQGRQQPGRTRPAGGGGRRR